MIMWKSFAELLLKNKKAFLFGCLLITAFMAFEASKLELSYEYPKVLPANDSTFIAYENFKKRFGQDGNVMVLGFQDSNLFDTKIFSRWNDLGKKIEKIEGVKEVISLPQTYNILRNDSLQKFDFVKVFNFPLNQNYTSDSIRTAIENMPFYDGYIYNKETHSTLIAVTFETQALNTKRRLQMAEDITKEGEIFSKNNNIKMYYSGLPYIRSQMMKKVAGEAILFLALAVIVMGIILWAFFRNFSVVFFSLLVVIIGVLWSLGSLQLFHYKITVLTGLLAPLMMVIGVPNCVFLINKYQSEFAIHGNKTQALSTMIETIGITLFLANITTSIGFGVLYFTNSEMLVEFGVIAAINVMATYLITLILIPVILFYLPNPTSKQTQHLSGKRINSLLAWVDEMVQHKRKRIYYTTAIATIISLIGLYEVKVVGFVIDDLPKKDPVFENIRFFEKNFHGILAFEIVVDTKKPNGLFENSASAIYKIRALQKIFAQYDEFSKPLSIVEGLKFSYQGYKYGDPKFYKLPNALELNKIASFRGNLKETDNKLNSFMDTARSLTRISYQMLDIGSQKMNVLMSEIRPRIDSVFRNTDYEVTLTGHSLMFLKNNDYLLSNLFESLIIEIILIALIGLALFRSVRIIVFSKIPCLIPLIITAGIMGFLDIRLKPSTILIFSVAFGISSDGTVYFLTKYRHELKKQKRKVTEAISIAIKETGLSMVYTTVILFLGFGIFAASDFGGTVALGVLVSLTLIISLATNLLLLPSILLSIHNRKLRKELTQKPLIEVEEDPV